MKKVSVLALVLLIAFGATAHAWIWHEDFTEHDFGDFTMVVPDGWAYADDKSNASQAFFFAPDARTLSTGAIMVSIGDEIDTDLSGAEELTKRFVAVLDGWGVGDFFYRDFEVDGLYAWFWDGELSLSSGGTYTACGYATHRNHRDYLVLLINPDSNGLNNSWRMNTMIDSIEWNDGK